MRVVITLAGAENTSVYWIGGLGWDSWRGFFIATASAPQVLKAARRQLCVAHRRLDTAMPEIRLQRTCIGAFVC